jgi:hypothetical protein
MGTVVEFPADAARRTSGIASAPRETSATIVILPAIRIERYADETDGEGPKEGTAPSRGRKRRARS